MPTYRYTPTLADHGIEQNVFGKLVRVGETVEVPVYLPQPVATQMGLVFVSDAPYISPLMGSLYQSGAAVNTKYSLILPDTQYDLDLYADIVPGGQIKISFNDEPNPTTFMTAASSGRIFTKLNARFVRVINATVLVANTTFCLYVTMRGQLICPELRGI